MFELSEQKKQLLKTEGNLLVLGGPGSGKTTIALLKAKRIIEEEGIKRGQVILFLSFARATISRVEEQVGLLISDKIRSHLEINTYHGFIWNLLKCHGYLINSNAPIRLLPPPEAASRFANISGKQAREEEKYRLFKEEGILHFDLFARIGADLLSRSNALAKVISAAYPVVILDEFQDTNSDEWEFIKAIGKRSRLIALADAEQRIYEFRGADPARIGEYIKEFHPTQFDFGIENNRSKDTDIVQFGNDILSGKNIGRKYKNVHFLGYPFRQGYPHIDLKFTVLKARKKIIDAGRKDWSIAVLVPSKRLMLEISSCFSTVHTLANGNVIPQIKHEVALETAGPSLAAILIAGVLELGSQKQTNADRLIGDLCEHIRGRKGDETPSKADLDFSSALLEYIKSGKIRGKNRQLAIQECQRIMSESTKIEFTGNPGGDWITVRNLIKSSTSGYLKQVENDAHFLRLLHKGSILSINLSNLWKDYGNYSGATEAVRNALLQEHFSTSTRVWKGVHVMTIHKSKGKEFDEVFVYEGRYQGKIVRHDASKKEMDQARINLRVAVTRAKQNATIVTPSDDVCILLK
ncbi:ATP-dependent helicase [Brevibacillus composti]|uniref:DNA 3'-5' helicase n=1 Tax=Brevibacillus composti TaxID=2796470 RepID=A0A7T5EIJ2_9BACL|nr:ATP-dependent helicase [Brevibacillus composti]QQE73205.1 ATP-dependent helicase [Brevibacillus composti]QUO40286.1 ATP-dependent helicase [Brevibacillus composti]